MTPNVVAFLINYEYTGDHGLYHQLTGEKGSQYTFVPEKNADTVFLIDEICILTTPIKLLAKILLSSDENNGRHWINAK